MFYYASFKAHPYDSIIVRDTPTIGVYLSLEGIQYTNEDIHIDRVMNLPNTATDDNARNEVFRQRRIK